MPGSRVAEPAEQSERTAPPGPGDAAADRGLVAVALVLALAPTALRLLDGATTLFFRDHLLAFRPLLRAVTDAYAEGRLPTWNPWAGGGEPLLGDWNALASSPLLMSFAAFGFDTAYDLFVFSHLPIAGLGAALAARMLGTSRAGAALAAAAYGASGVVAAFNNLVPALEALAFAPWALAAAWGVASRPSLSRIAGLGAALALHAQFADPVFFLWDALAFVGGVERRRRLGHSPTLRGGLGLVGGALLSVGLVAFHLFPLFDDLSRSARGAGFSTGRTGTFALAAPRALELFLPGFGGDYEAGINLFAPASDARFYLVSIYAGGALVPLLGYGVLRAKSSRFWLGLAVASVVVALGPATPLHGWIQGVVPGLSASRYPIKHLAGAAFALPLAGAIALDRLREASSPRDVRGLLVASGATLAVMVAGFGAGELATHERADRIVGAAVGWGSLFALTSIGLVAVAALRANLRGVAGALLPLVVALDVGLVSARAFPVIDGQALAMPAVCDVVHESADDVAVPGVMLYDAYRAPRHLDDPSLQEVAAYGWHRGFVGTAPVCEVRHVFDQDLSGRRSDRWRALWQAGLSAAPTPRRNLLRRLGVTHVLSESPRVAAPRDRFVGAVEPVGGPDLRVYRVSGSRGFVTVEDDVMRGADVDPARAAMEDYRAPSLRRSEATRHEAGRIETTVTATTGVVLVVAQQWHDGWRATVDESEVAPFAVDGFLLGVDVPAGTHEVRLSFEPTSVTIGWTVSLVAWILFAAALSVDRLRSSKPRGVAMR